MNCPHCGSGFIYDDRREGHDVYDPDRFHCLNCGRNLNAPRPGRLPDVSKRRRPAHNGVRL